MFRNTLDFSPEQNVISLLRYETAASTLGSNSDLLEASIALIHSEAVMVYLVHELF